MIKIKRVYEAREPDDGERFLVDRLWPRGIRKDAIDVVAWAKDAGPSNELRHWFGHDPAKWAEFQKRFRAELAENTPSWQPILDAARKGTVTLVYSSRETEHNNAVALKAFLDEQLTD